MKRVVRRVLLLTILVLYVISIPWYRSSDAEPGLLLGLPDWVGVALICYVGVALLNSVAWLLTEVPDPDLSERSGLLEPSRLEREGA